MQDRTTNRNDDEQTIQDMNIAEQDFFDIGILLAMAHGGSMT